MSEAEAILTRLVGLHPKAIDLGLDRLRALLEKLGNPHLSLPPIIHIAGTNGKGSTSAFARAMAEAQGLKVHVYTSPHLIHFRERIRLAGELVSDEALLEALRECERVNDGEPITFFEITTAAAFMLFSRNKADLLILEVGLGGRLDATNVIPSPMMSVITAIAYDHIGYLGSELSGIAREKAGIMKKGRPAVFVPQEDEVRGVLDEEAERVGAGPLFIGAQDWMCFEENGRLVYQSANMLLDLPLPKLIGRHQYINAGAAITALLQSDLPISEAAIAKGLVSVQWPGRLQQIRSGALMDLIQPDAELWLDGGHNPHAGVALSGALADLEDKSPKPLFMICGMLNTKDPEGYFVSFKGLVRDIITVPITSSDAGIDPVDLAKMAQSAGIAACASASLGEALKRLSLLARENPSRILISGSLYLVGEALDMNGTALR